MKKKILKKLGLFIALASLLSACTTNAQKADAPNFDNAKPSSYWKKKLSPEVYEIMVNKGTERPYSGELCSVYEEGKYNCVCCDSPLFDSTIKFESSSGWPSFTQPIQENAIKYHKDSTLGMVRVEVLCNVCDAHLGHVFPDGPEPSGLRYCINSESMVLDKN